MIILGTWALSNIALNGGLLLRNGNLNQENKYFMQMNIYWNTVNLVIAGYGLYNTINGDAYLSPIESLAEQNKIEKILLFNTGLDVAYIMGGLWLQEKGNSKHSERLKGYGKSLILQGSFLISFDLIFYLIHKNHSDNLEKILSTFQITQNGPGFKFIF
ncbi:DUF6992 family protein [Marinigracilibium pacificum]|nr:hypothetical protein [Marinigracilibium pacificum]